MLRAVLCMRSGAGRCERVGSARRLFAARLDDQCDDSFCIDWHASGHHIRMRFVSEIAPSGLFCGLGIPDHCTRSRPCTKRRLSSLEVADFVQFAFNIVRPTLTCEVEMSTSWLRGRPDLDMT